MKQRVQKQIKKALSENTSCYVLITCDPPTANGEMHVEMSYEGDAAVAAYLLQGAQTFIDSQDLDDLSHAEDKVLHLDPSVSQVM